MDVHAPLNPTSLFNANGLVVVITGGGSGIGLAFASTLYQNGASKIYILGRRLNVLQDAASSLFNSPSAPQRSSETPAIVPIACDVTQPDSISAAVAQIEKETGYVDVLINNAGVIGPLNGTNLTKADDIKALRDLMLHDWSQWAPTMAINTSSVIGVSAQFLPLLSAANERRGFQPGKMAAQARHQDRSALQQLGCDGDDDRMAQIITVASVASFMRYCTAGLAYNASKAAAAHLAKMLSTILADWGIRSNVVCPGPFPSDMSASAGAGVGANIGVYPPNQVPQGRMGNANDVAGLLLFLVGKGGAYINGSVQLTDGGRVGQFPGVF